MRDWQRWHDDYADPASELSRRLATVQEAIRTWACERPNDQLRLLSLCAGQGHDVVGALRNHPRRGDVSGLLVELDPDNVAAANDALREADLLGLRAVVGDAGAMSSLRSTAPADLVLVCGVFGNITDEDVRRTVAALPALCTPGGTVIWTRHRREPDLTPSIRAWFAGAGFEEVTFSSSGPGRFAVGVHRSLGASVEPAERRFRFVR